MTRLDLAPDNQFAAIITSLLNDIDQLKRPQIIGASSLVSHYTKSGNTWDINAFAVSAFQTKIWKVTFTPDPGKNNKPYAEFAFAYAVGNSDFFETVEWYPDPSNATDDATRSYYLIFNNDANATTFFARFGVKSSHTGSLTVTLVS